MKASQYSTEWHIYQQHSSFSGVDTCEHVVFNRFDKPSILRFEVKDKAIANRYDINSYLDTMCKNNVISSHYRSTMRKSSDKYNSENDFSYLCSSGMYVPIDAVMEFQRKSRKLKNIIKYISEDRDFPF